MGGDALDTYTEQEREIIKRRETLSDGSIWPMHMWDYTEWEEFLLEVQSLKP